MHRSATALTAAPLPSAARNASTSHATSSDRRASVVARAGEAGGSESTIYKDLNKYSRKITQPKQQGASQAMLYATGMKEADMVKAQVGIASCWFDGNPCNMHLHQLSENVANGVRSADLVGFRFNTVGVSDAISMGTDGMSYSLQSRDLIADSVETVMGAQHYDGLIALPGCDKNMPGVLIAMGRLNRPAIMVYGGTIRPGTSSLTGKDLNIVDAFQSYGAFQNKKITEEERQDAVRHACPGAGACGGMYTANTMASSIEALGMALPFSSSIPADDPLKLDECTCAPHCRIVGKYMLQLMAQDVKPRDIMTRKAFENAMVTVIALGGSTNAVLHLIAMAHSVGISLTLDDFQRVSDRVPYIADLKPSGRYLMEDLHQVGGTPAVLKYLLAQGLLDGSCKTCTTHTLEKNLEQCPELKQGQDIILPRDRPLKETGHIQIIYGNLAPEGSVAKITGKEGERFSGEAVTFNSEEEMIAKVEENPEQLRGKVLVIRYEGPKGGPGMPEMLGPTSAIMGAGLGDACALITDGRFSGGSHGFVVGHVCPEALEGGPIALVQDGDTITIDCNKDERKMTLDVDDAELERRRASWQPPAPKHRAAGILHKYTKLVSSASTGCVTDL